MFRSRSKFDNEAPMSRRGMRVGLVLTVVLAMVAVLASTVGVLSSQSTAPSLTFDNSSHGTFNDVPEGETFSITYTSSSSAGYTLTLDLDRITTPLAGFDFVEDIERNSFKVTPNMGSETTITKLPQDVTIESGTTMITITFKAANDLYVEPNESFTLSATPGSGSPKTTTITLQDPGAVTVGLSGLSVNGTTTTTITEGQTGNIGITLSRPLTEFDGLSDSNPLSSYKQSSALTGSNYEDISTSGTKVYTAGDDHNREYFVTFTDGFEFEFFGATYRDVSISTNGFLSIGGPNRGTANTLLFEDNFGDNKFKSGSKINNVAVTDNTPPIVAPFWIDLDLRSSNSSLYREVRGVAPNRRFIVQYNNIEYRPGGAARGRATFQVVLFETTGRIEFRYESISDNQNNAAIGITDGSGEDYAQVGIVKSTTTRVVDNDTRIVFTPDNINIVTKDAADQVVDTYTYDIIDEIGFSASTGMIVVSPADNNEWDGNQVHTVALESPTIPLVVADATGPVTYTVMDNDAPMVTLERVSGNGPIAEGGSVELIARLTNAPDGAPEELTVNLARATASTAGTGDYDMIPSSVTIPAGEQISNSFTVMINGDTEVELNENLIIEVTSLVYGAKMGAPTTPSEIDLTITDDDNIMVRIIPPTKTTYNEGEIVELMVSLASGVTTVTTVTTISDITVNYQTSTDSVPRVATIPAGQSTVAITIATTDDNDAEETEMLRVTLTDASPINTALNAKVDISTTSQTRDITILDNEPLAYNFVGSGTVSEGGTPYTVRLRRLGKLPDGGDATVAYTVGGSGSSAASAADFGGSFPRGNFVFSNYAAESAEVRLTGADDDNLEGDETFRITAGGETHDVKLVDNESWDIGIVRLGTTDSPEEGDLVRFRIELMLEPGVRTTTDITVEYEIMASPGLVAVSAPGLRSGFAQGLALPVRGLAQAQLVNLKRTATIPAGQDGVDIAIQLDESPDDTQQLTVNLGGVSTNSGDPLPAVPFTGPSIPVAIPSALTVPVLDRVVEDDFFGVLPPTGGPVLPVWLLLVLLLTGIALPLTALKLNR